MKTGYPLRVIRNGVGVNVDFSELTYDELKVIFADKDRDELLRWIISIHNSIKEV